MAVPAAVEEPWEVGPVPVAAVPGQMASTEEDAVAELEPMAASTTEDDVVDSVAAVEVEPMAALTVEEDLVVVAAVTAEKVRQTAAAVTTMDHVVAVGTELAVVAAAETQTHPSLVPTAVEDGQERLGFAEREPRAVW